MTEQEAIDLLRFAFPKEITKPITEEVISMAVSALEKQIPMKPFETYDDDTCIYKHFECPNCEDRLSRHSTNMYCMRCGQLIDWRKKNDI